MRWDVFSYNIKALNHIKHEQPQVRLFRSKVWDFLVLLTYAAGIFICLKFKDGQNLINIKLMMFHYVYCHNVETYLKGFSFETANMFCVRCLIQYIDNSSKKI